MVKKKLYNKLDSQKQSLLKQLWNIIFKKIFFFKQYKLKRKQIYKYEKENYMNESYVTDIKLYNTLID